MGSWMRKWLDSAERVHHRYHGRSFSCLRFRSRTASGERS
jgi:hypothetical protein